MTIDAVNPTCNIALTDAAQERILDLRDNMHKPAMIRLYVQGGGCSGFEYKIDLARETDEDDILVQINPYIHIYVDQVSAPYLEGTTIDYEAHPGLAIRVQQPAGEKYVRVRVELFGRINHSTVSGSIQNLKNV